MRETMWTFETKNLRIVWEIEPDNDLDLSFDDTGEVAEKLDSGEYVAFISRVYVQDKRTDSVLGEDHLGGSIYANPAGFRDHIGMNARGHGSYFSDMVRAACAEARKTLKAMRPIRVRNTG